jgi:DNA-binding NtrC family response regulator
MLVALTGQAQVVVVSADDPTRDALASLLGGAGHAVEAVSGSSAALALMERALPDVLLVDLVAEGDDPYAFCERARLVAPDLAIVAVSEEGALDRIVEAIKRGADHYLTRPVRVEALNVVLDRALEKLARRGDVGRMNLGDFERIIGSHPLMQQLLTKAFQAARSRATVLIHGETGTGKELIAAAIHRNSKRAGGPFVRLNCASLAESVLESELFGHERGAFTGALVRRKGRLEQAHRGTLFLDEVSEIPMPVQVKLLRFLQEREIERVGGDDTLRVDVRVVAATNRELKAMVDDKTFREDLYYRLNVVRLDVPPLRARPGDIPLLSEHFLRIYAEENDKQIRGFTEAARKALVNHPWPGNVRELQNIIEQAAVLCEQDEIDLSDLPLAHAATDEEPVRLMIPGVTLAELERYAIMKTLDAVGGSPSKAAAILGVSRRTIQYRMRQWGLGAPAKAERA